MKSSTLVLRVGALAGVLFALGCGNGGSVNDAGGSDAHDEAGSEVGDVPTAPVPDGGDAKLEDDAAVAPDGPAPDVVVPPDMPDAGSDVVDATPKPDASSDATDAVGIDTRDAGGISLSCTWLGDFDGDGLADCARVRTSASNQRDLVFNKGVGPSAYSPAEVVTLDVVPSVFGLTPSTVYYDLGAGVVSQTRSVFDLDHDGRQDIVVYYPNPLDPLESILLRYFRGGSDGTFTSSAGTGLQTRQLRRAYAGSDADFDGDGKPDLFCLANTADLYLRFTYVVLSGDKAIQSPAFTVRGFGGVAAVVDINGDGKLDVIAVVEPNGLGGPPTPVSYVGISYGKGNGTFDAIVTVEGTQTELTLPSTGSIGLTVSDVNGDGKLDMVVQSRFPTRTLYGDGAGHFSPTPPT
jgi:hypothetical protein